jgi:hypothetical protein
MEPEAPAQDVAVAAKRAEMTAELRRARRWILAVGILLYTFDMALTWSGTYGQIPAWLKYQVSLFDGIVLLLFVALWWFAQSRPRLCCVLALVLYWGLQVWLSIISGNMSQLFQGALLKILFTAALIQAIKSAQHASQLRADLAQVFG